MEDGGLVTHPVMHLELEHYAKNVTFITSWAMDTLQRILIIVKFVKLQIT